MINQKITFLQTLECLKTQHPKANLYFIQSNIALKQTAKPDRFIKLDLNNLVDLKTQLWPIEIKNILGLVYKNYNPKTKALDLFFTITSEKNETWLSLEEVEDLYIRKTLDTAMFYASGYLHFAKRGLFQDFYPLD